MLLPACRPFRPSVVAALLALTALAAPTAPGLSAQSKPAPGAAATPRTAAARRAVLLDPAHPFWKAKAPDTVMLDMETSRGAITIELIREWAPHGVDRFYNLARAGYFDDSRFYRVIPYYIAQFGLAKDPAVGNTWRARKLRPDPLRTSNVRGTVTFAQYKPTDRAVDLFINLRDSPELDSMRFAPVGRVVAGMDVADSIHFGYGELPSMAAPMGDPRRFYGETNRYLDKEYPKLDRIVSVKIRR